MSSLSFGFKARLANPALAPLRKAGFASAGIQSRGRAGTWRPGGRSFPGTQPAAPGLARGFRGIVFRKQVSQAGKAGGEMFREVKSFSKEKKKGQKGKKKKAAIHFLNMKVKWHCLFFLFPSPVHRALKTVLYGT